MSLVLERVETSEFKWCCINRTKVVTDRYPSKGFNMSLLI